MFYQKHIFICTNERANGERKSCGSEHGMQLVAKFKKLIKDSQLTIPVRAQKCGCLDLCDQGPTVVVYPDAVFYGGVQLEDVSEIVESHIVNNIPVERLRLRANNVLPEK